MESKVTKTATNGAILFIRRPAVKTCIRLPMHGAIVMADSVDDFSEDFQYSSLEIS